MCYLCSYIKVVLFHADVILYIFIIALFQATLSYDRVCTVPYLIIYFQPKVNPQFLHANANSHTWPFSAVAELTGESVKSKTASCHPTNC